MFKSRPEHYIRNTDDAQQVNARPATMEGRQGDEPAVGIFYDRQIRYVLPITDALRVANEIADAIGIHSKKDSE